jgi:hypothetical protein
MKQPVRVDELIERVQTAWDAARRSLDMPRRIDIDPVKLGAALQYMSLLDVVPGDPLDFKYRVFGQHLIKGYGIDLTGQLHTAIADRSRPAWPHYEAYVTCFTTKRPQTIDIQARNRKKLLIHLQGRVWPLSDDGNAVTGILGAGIYDVPAALAN